MGMAVMVAMVVMVVTASTKNMVKRRVSLVRMMEAGVNEVLDVRLWQSYCFSGYQEFGK